jgi:hypothetical protein
MSAPIYTGGRPFFKGGIRTKYKLIASGGGATTLTKAQSNSVFLMDVAAGGITYTLPVPVSGLFYTFLWSVGQTSGTNEVITDSANTFMLGSVVMFSGEKVTPSSTLGPFQFNANGTTHVEMETNGTTLGGGAGSYVEFFGLSATQWYVTGYLNSPSGNLATPFST